MDCGIRAWNPWPFLVSNSLPVSLSLVQSSYLFQPSGSASIPFIHHAVWETADRGGGNQHFWPGVRQTGQINQHCIPLCGTLSGLQREKQAAIMGLIHRNDTWIVLDKVFWSCGYMYVTVMVLCVWVSHLAMRIFMTAPQQDYGYFYISHWDWRIWKSTTAFFKHIYIYMHTKGYVKWYQDYLKLHVAICIIHPMINVLTKTNSNE